MFRKRSLSMEDGNGTIFSFDLGTGSLATCVREGEQIPYINVEYLPGEFGTLNERRSRIRQIRTRIAHKQREEWWKKHAKEAGIEVLETGHLDENGNFISPDPRMSCEFSKDNDSIIYNSLLLRIALLQGKQLEGWQIFKAIWNAIQRRGYDAELPWKHKTEYRKQNEDETEETEERVTRKRKTKKENDDKENDEEKVKQAVENYKLKLKENFGDKEEYFYPSYLEATILGIWSPDEPNNFSKKVSENSAPIRNKDGNIQHIAPAELVEKELKKLLEQAGKQYPYIEKNLSYILYGPSGCKYGAYKLPEYRRFMGRDWEWQGLLSQKTPRFDNRIIYKCRLIPRLNVCKRKDPLCQQQTFLMKLKNFRYVDGETGEEKALTPEQIQQIFEEFKSSLKINNRELKKYIKEKIRGFMHPSFTVIEPPKTDGRGSLSRPALKILKEIILTGKSPHALYQEYTSNNTNTDPKKGLVNDDYKFLLRMPETWDNFHIPDEREEEAQLNEEERLNKIVEILSKITNPVVRHRLFLFYKKLEELKQKFGTPDKIMLEFARDPEELLAGEKKKQEYIQLQRDNKAKKDKASRILQELQSESIDFKGRSAPLKIQLWQEQNGIDPYSGKEIAQTEIVNCEIDHIVPREMGGSDAYINKVLTTAEMNREKKKRTPYQWFGNNPSEWKKYLDNIEKLKSLSTKKKALLTSETPEELMEKYTHLAETAYISRLAQKICHLFFGWEQLTKGSERKVFVVSGAFTEKVRRIFQLDSILYPELSVEQYKELIQKGEINKKNRSNPRHHALDTIVLSIIPEIKYNPEKGKDDYPVWFNKEYCKDYIENCFPKPIRFTKPKLAETIYGLRELPERDKNGKKQYVFVTRFGTGTSFKEYEDLNFAKKNVSNIYSLNIRKDFEEKLKENPTSEEWKVFVYNYRAGGKPKKLLVIASSIFGEDEVQKFLKGETKNLGEFIKGKMPGQFLKQRQESHGYFVYKNEKGKWQREVIYAFESPYKKKKEILSRYKGSKEDIYFFKSGMLVELEESTSVKGEERLKKGYYYLNTILNNNFCKLTSIDGQHSDVISLNTLMEQGKMRPA